MELYQLRTFAAVGEVGHLTRAAERLHLSQPAVSGQIKALERELDLRLFERTRGGMSLTPAGRELLAEAQRVLAAADAFKHRAQRLAGVVSGKLRLATVSDPESIRLGDLTAATVAQYPQVELELHHEVSGAALEGVRDGRFDISFFYGDQPGADFRALRLREFVYCVTAPAAWQERIERADWAAIATLPWVLTPAISTHNRLVTRLFEQQGVTPPERGVEADTESVIGSLVRSGVGVSLMREELARGLAASGEVCIWPQARLRTTLWFVCAADRAADPIVKAMFGLQRDIWPLDPEPPPTASEASRVPAPADAD
jgi:DNA-binding transcriptional LysR family regulator